MVNSYLAHHGILGQKWGQKNGPPYPIGSSGHSKSEQRAGWRKSLDKDSSKSENGSKEHKGLTDKQKKALLIAGGVGLAVVGTYAAYKLGAFDAVKVARGKTLAEQLARQNTYLAGEAQIPGDSKNVIIDGNLTVKDISGYNSIDDVPKVDNPSFSEGLINANRLSGENFTNSRTQSQLAGFCYNEYNILATAKSSGGKPLNPREIAQDVFGIDLDDTSRYLSPGMIKFGESPKEAKAMLVRRFGNDAKGIVSLPILDSDVGHEIYFEIKNGICTFTDYKHGFQDYQVVRYWDDAVFSMDRGKYAHTEIIRLDGLKPNMEKLAEYIDILEGVK